MTTTTSTALDLTGSMTQVFKVQVPDGVPGLYITGIDLFFATKSSSFGAQMQLLELSNGLPDASRTIPGSVVTLTTDQITASNNGSTATRFQFSSPIYLTAAQSYAFSVRGLGNSPDYQLYTAINGDADLTSGISVSSNPLSGAAYYAKNSTTWQQIPNEDLKYTIYRAQFDVSTTSVARLKKSPNEIWTLRNLGIASGPLNIMAGDEVYAFKNDSVLDTTKNAKVVKYDYVNNFLYLRNSTGNFAADDRIAVCRVAVEGNVSSNTDGMMLLGNIADIYDMPLHGIVPKIAVVNNPLTSASIQYRGTYKEGDPAVPVKQTGPNDWINLKSDNETEFFDITRYALSFSNEKAALSGNTSVELAISMTSTSDYCSPAIDLNSHSFIGIENLINSETTGEEGDYGLAATRYISKTVTLADGQESEDLHVYVDAYKPAGTIMLVYGKFWNNQDPDTFSQKPWTLLTQITDGSVFSTTNKFDDYREYEFRVPNVSPTVSGAAWSPLIVNPIDGDPLQYTTSLGTFIGFKQFAIKVVLAVQDETTAYNYPRLNDIRAIALQK
jgi:hypothetical protein